MYCEEPAVLPPEPPYCEVPTKLGVELAYCDSGRGNSIEGGWGADGPESAARDADREPDASLLARLPWRRWPCSCAAYSGPRYCDKRTVLRFS
jgi:hypothetical protein